MPLAQLRPSLDLLTRRRSGWIGVDIGAASVKLAQLEIVNGKKEIAEAAIFPIPQTANCSPASIRGGWLSHALQQQVLRYRRFRGQTAACGISLSLTEFRSLTIPPGSDRERREMIALELAPDSGPRSEAMEFDFWDGCANPNDSAGTNTVNMLSVSQELATAVAEALYQSGLHCRTLDGGPFILARAAELVSPSETKPGPIGVLDWGHSGAQFIVMRNAEPLFTRVFKGCAVNQLVQAVAGGLKLPDDECRQLLADSGLADPRPGSPPATPAQENVWELATQAFQTLKSELDKTLAYLRHQRPELAPAEICLLGGGSTIRNAAARLSAEFGLPFFVWRMPQRATAGTALTGQPVELLAQAAALSELRWAS
ncbi:MAG TPA: hypothetical protein VM165_19720 [Planctomycetaceae bacterium]|nr:hypothetical protein [Planctomycetaceae bacterium]